MSHTGVMETRGQLKDQEDEQKYRAAAKTDCRLCSGRLWGVVPHWWVRYLASGGSQVRILLQGHV